jgi:hypothetical protein
MFLYLILQFGLIGDGVTTTSNINLETSPYIIGPLTTSTQIQPKFNPITKLPVGVFGGSGNPTETISGHILTITFTTAPATGPFTQGVIVEYAP